jgi:hypothetical protein
VDEDGGALRIVSVSSGSAKSPAIATATAFGALRGGVTPKDILKANGSDVETLGHGIFCPSRDRIELFGCQPVGDPRGSGRAEIVVKR